MAVTSAGGTTSTSPRRNRAAPTPPARTVITVTAQPSALGAGGSTLLDEAERVQRDAMGDLAPQNLHPAGGRLVVEQDPARCMETRGLAIVHSHPVAVDLGNAIRRPRIQRRLLGLRNLEHLA